MRYGQGSNLMGLLGTVLTDGVAGTPRWRVWLRAVAAPTGGGAAHAERPAVVRAGAIALVMQSVDNSLTVSGVRSRLGRWKLTSQAG